MKKLFVVFLAISVLLIPNSVLAKNRLANNDQYFIVRAAEGDYISDAEGNVYAGFKDALGNDVDLEEALSILLATNGLEPVFNSVASTLGSVDPFNITITSRTTKYVGSAIKVTPDYQGPCTITYGITKTIGTSIGVSGTLTYAESILFNAKLSISANFTLSTQTTTTLSSTFPVDAGRIGAVYFKPYYVRVKGTLVDNGITYSFDNCYPRYLGNASVADGLYYIQYSK